MRLQTLGRIFGAVYVLLGIAGFVTLLAPAAPPDAQVVSLTSAYAWLFGIFPVNQAHDAVHILVGLLALLSSVSFRRSRTFFRATFVLFAILTVLGSIQITSTLFGIAPLYGWDVALHAVTALFALFAGWGAPSREPAIDIPIIG
jgi:hypothetical protein